MAVPTLEEILTVAFNAGASDIHITVGLPPVMRLNGHLMQMDYPVLTANDTLEICVNMLKPKQREKFEERGEYDLSVSFPNIGRYRVNVFKQRGCIGIALRTVTTEIPQAEKLGIPQSVIDLHTRKRGLILVTGPTGSGKSTTLASIIDKINKTRDAHIITLEEPIEYSHEHRMAMVNQREVGQDTESFANALRAALREDPDVILVGEMRDYETISTAITAAETGHLVLSTLHTNDAASTVDRIIDVFPPHQQQQIRTQLAAVLVCIISQSLIPNLDEDGRVAAFEVMHANAAVKNLVREGKTHQLQSIIQTSKREGMCTMDDYLMNLYMARKISKENCIQYAQNPDKMSTQIF
ncbi:MAG: type IV pilus twitching motility protein PilT [Lachnospiraceae bacterium]|nr:type IV pilus twitching motility protein PilT [Lachnospiraceae bacterium]